MPIGPSRAGTAGAYAYVPRKLAHQCPKCGAGRGRLCFRTMGDQHMTMKGTHRERRSLSPRNGGTPVVED